MKWNNSSEKYCKMFKLFVITTVAYIVSGANIHSFGDELIDVVPEILGDDTPPTSFANCPVVDTTTGKLQGASTSCGLFCSYCQYNGIPYAQPPIGNLRFRAPLPHTGWEGVRDASEHGNECLNNEDCLFINVYTRNVNGHLPVMVWIHGGAYSLGSGNSGMYGPDYIIGEDVLMVSFNYRLGIVGFMSTGDSNATGNYGMKDMVLALKWIKANIARFGGDPDNITIFGESAGGSAVHYLLLSPNARGLFARAISQSGSALNPWTYQTNPEAVAHQLGRDLGLTWSNNSDLVNQFRQLPLTLLNTARPGPMSYPIPRGLLPIPFVPCTDPADTPRDEVFLPRTPIDIMTSGDFIKVPYITGFNSDESLFMIRELLLDPNVFPTLNAYPSLLIPNTWQIPTGSVEAQTIVDEIKDFYFEGQLLSHDLRYEYSMYNTDLMFAHGIDQTARIHSEHQTDPVYYYQFSFVGALNMFKNILLLNNYPGAVHADDLFYLFRMIPLPLLPSNPAMVKLRLMVRMWTNFAKYGNPTPLNDPVATIKWPRVNGNQEFLQINTTVTAERFPHHDRMAFWNRLQETHATIKK